MSATPDEADTRTCTLPGCGKPLKAKGLCAKHWSANRRHGSPYGKGVVGRPRIHAIDGMRNFERAHRIPGVEPLTCPDCGAVVVADPRGLAWPIIADARGNHDRYCTKENAA